MNDTDWISRDSVVAFHFSHPMSPEYISISWTKDGGPLSTGSFAYQWAQLITLSLGETELGGGWMEFEILDEFDHEVFWLEGSDIVGGTECQIPPSTLESGRSYVALLTFVRITDWEENLYSEVMGVAGFESSTQFTITAGGQVDLPSVQLEQIGSVAQLNFSKFLENRSYALDVSSDLKRWTPLAGIWGGYSQFEDFDAVYLKSRFYRLRECTYDEDLTPHIAVQGTVWQDYAKTAPVAGAVVGTSLDEQVTLTDAKGTFFLVNDTPAQNGEANYSIEVSKGAQSRSFGPYQWGDQPRQQDFILE